MNPAPRPIPRNGLAIGRNSAEAGRSGGSRSGSGLKVAEVSGFPSASRRRMLQALLLAAGPLAALRARPARSATPPGGPAGPDAGLEVPVGGVLPDVPLRGLNGPSRRLAEYRGRPLLINVWASWCGPCMAEMASLERLAWLDEQMPFSMIGISTDDDAGAALEVLQRSRATLHHYIDERLQMEHLLGARTIPLTVLVDAAGRVVDRVHGARDWDSTESLARIARGFRLSRIPGSQEARERR